MFCPRCGDLMIESLDTLFCVRGNMFLSQNMLNKLNESFILQIRPPKNHELLTGTNGNWFCPNHGEKMVNKNGYACCPVCNLSISEFIYELTRLNPHLNFEH